MYIYKYKSLFDNSLPIVEMQVKIFCQVTGQFFIHAGKWSCG